MTTDADDKQREAEQGNAFRTLRHRNFRLVWFGQLFATMGLQIQFVAIAWHLFNLTDSTFQVALAAAFGIAPFITLSFVGGALADKFDRRKLLIATQSIMAISSVLMGLATNMGWASAALIYGVSALTSATVAFDNPARGALVPNLVPRRHLPNALSLNIIVWQIATIVGPMLAGIFVAIGFHGLALIYWIDGVSFTAVIIALWLMRVRPQAEATRNVSFGAALDGLRFLRKTPIILSTMVLDFFATFLAAATLLLPAVAEQILKIDRQYWGFLYSAPAVGAASRFSTAFSTTHAAKSKSTKAISPKKKRWTQNSRKCPRSSTSSKRTWPACSPPSRGITNRSKHSSNRPR